MQYGSSIVQIFLLISQRRQAPYDINAGRSNRHAFVDVGYGSIWGYIKGYSSSETAIQYAVCVGSGAATIGQNREVRAILLGKFGIVGDGVRANHEVSEVKRF